MMRKANFVLLLIMLHGIPSFAQDSSVPRYGQSNYGQLKLWYEDYSRRNPSSPQRVEGLRAVIRSKFGEQGLQRQYSSFEGRNRIDPLIPGVEKNLLLAASDNPNVARGARRTQLYANRIHNDRRFLLLALDEPTTTSLGKTDKDIRLRHRSSGMTGRIEVKDWTETTQRSNLRKIQTQIRKMHLSQQATGEKQALLFRRPAIPQIRRAAQRYGIPLYDNVATGEVSKRQPGVTAVEDVLDDLDRSFTANSRIRILGAGASVGFGLVSAIQSGRQAVTDFDHARIGRDSWSRFGANSSLAVSGVSMTVSGLGELGAVLATGSELAGTLQVVSRGGAIAAAGAFLVAEGFLVHDWYQGNTSNREFIQTQSSLAGSVGGGLAGAWLGAKAGAAIGSFFPGPGTIIGSGVGAAVGGIGGAWGLSSGAAWTTDAWYSSLDAERDLQLRRFIYESYGANQP